MTVKIPPACRPAPRFASPARARPASWADRPATSSSRCRYPHPIVRREGDNLYVPLPVTVPEAMLGAQVRAPTFTGEVTLTVPPHSQSGRKLRLKGQGVPSLKGNGRGDLYFELRIQVPRRPPPR